jgi:hypothetical protein
MRVGRIHFGDWFTNKDSLLLQRQQRTEQRTNVLQGDEVQENSLPHHLQENPFPHHPIPLPNGGVPLYRLHWKGDLIQCTNKGTKDGKTERHFNFNTWAPWSLSHSNHAVHIDATSRHSLQYLLSHWCSQTLDPLHSLLALAPLALVLADARSLAFLASAPYALVLADARSLAFLAWAPSALVLADARSLALLAYAPLALVLAHARSLAFLADAPSALVLADARSLALLAASPYALVLADARSLALLALAPLALV